MQWQSSPYVLLLFLAAVTSLLWAFYGLKATQNEGQKPYIRSFVVLCLAVTIWSGAYAFQLASPTLEAKLLAYKILHIGGVMVPPAWLAFALVYSGRAHWLTRTTVGGMVAIPLVLLLALPTNPYSLALTEAHLETFGSLTVLVTGDGPLYLLHLAYSYTIIFVGTCLIVLHAVRSQTLIQRQSFLLITGAVVPLVLNVFNVLSIPPIDGIGVNLTPISLSLSTVLFGVAIVQYRMLDLTPVAWKTVLAQMSDGVIVLDDRERIVELNEASESLVGSSGLVLGEGISSILPQYDKLKQNNPFLVPLQGVNNEERLVQLTRSPLLRNDETYGWVVLVQDVTVTERQRRELQLQNERLDKFAQIVSHDLKNPLNVIAGYTDFAEQTGEQEHFDRIRDAVARMSTFLEELLLLSQQGETITEFQPVALSHVVETVTGEIGDEHLSVDIMTDMVLMADENRLRQVLDNLFRNARDHNGGDVTVRVGELPNGFYVEDDGAGISDDARQNIFEVGYTTRTEGSGFGLAIIQDIIDAHGWSIAVSDASRGGARFDISGVDVVGPE